MTEVFLVDALEGARSGAAPVVSLDEEEFDRFRAVELAADDAKARLARQPETERFVRHRILEAPDGRLQQPEGLRRFG